MLTAAPSLPPRCRAPPGSWHSRYRCSGAPSVAEEHGRVLTGATPACRQCCQIPRSLTPLQPQPCPASPSRREAGALFLRSLQRALWEGSGGFPNNSCLGWHSLATGLGWTIWVSCPVGAAVAFGSNAKLPNPSRGEEPLQAGGNT